VEVRLAATSDLHGHLPKVPACDVLVIAGDVTPVSRHDIEFQARWLDTDFRQWLEAVPAQHIIGIAGNHDFVFEQAPETVPRDLPWTYLQDEAACVNGLRLWGSPWTPWFYDWAFNAPRHDSEEAFLEERYAAVGDDTDVLLVHGPPRGFGDLTYRDQRVGSSALLRLVDRVRPALCVFGHIHEARGSWTRGSSILANVSAVDLQYRPVAEPVVTFDL
jgi:Icc-related predicted phosphoesterase